MISLCVYKENYDGGGDDEKNGKNGSKSGSYGVINYGFRYDLKTNSYKKTGILFVEHF